MPKGEGGVSAVLGKIFLKVFRVQVKVSASKSILNTSINTFFKVQVQIL